MIASLKTLRLAATGAALAILAAASLIGAGPASAHHSASMFDRSKPIVLKGTIKAFNWVNPHCSIIVIDEKSGETWNIESTSPGVLTRSGWTKRSLKPGDHVEMTVGPLRTGGPAGVSMEVKNLDTGETLKRAV